MMPPVLVPPVSLAWYTLLVQEKVAVAQAGK